MYFRRRARGPGATAAAAPLALEVTRPRLARRRRQRRGAWGRARGGGRRSGPGGPAGEGGGPGPRELRRLKRLALGKFKSRNPTDLAPESRWSFLPPLATLGRRSPRPAGAGWGETRRGARPPSPVGYKNRSSASRTRRRRRGVALEHKQNASLDNKNKRRGPSPPEPPPARTKSPSVIAGGPHRASCNSPSLERRRSSPRRALAGDPVRAPRSSSGPTQSQQLLRGDGLKLK